MAKENAVLDKKEQLNEDLTESFDFDELEEKADEALEQIEEKKYEKELRSDGYKNIIKYGISFFGKDCMIKIGNKKLK